MNKTGNWRMYHWSLVRKRKFLVVIIAVNYLPWYHYSQYIYTLHIDIYMYIFVYQMYMYIKLLIFTKYCYILLLISKNYINMYISKSYIIIFHSILPSYKIILYQQKLILFPQLKPISLFHKLTCKALNYSSIMMF